VEKSPSWISVTSKLSGSIWEAIWIAAAWRARPGEFDKQKDVKYVAKKKEKVKEDW
jgi:hypothetical protein